jgi:dTDP-4-dehydrorhamnose 3,5-epimerase
MKSHPTPIEGLRIFEASPLEDARGQFERLFCAEEFAALGLGTRFVQANRSVTMRSGTVRGIHFQRPPRADAKLVRCLRGRVFDVAVDLRAGSPTFGRWHGVELTPDGNAAVFLPEGFGHGFQALCDGAELLYFHTAAYAPELEGGLRHDDPGLRIEWPLPVALVSERDGRLPVLDARWEGLPR